MLATNKVEFATSDWRSWAALGTGLLAAFAVLGRGGGGGEADFLGSGIKLLDPKPYPKH